MEGVRPSSPGRVAFRENLLKELPHLAKSQSLTWTSTGLWVAAILIYTYAVGITVHSSTPPCKCNGETNQVALSSRIEYRDEIACDPVRWALWGANGTLDDEPLPPSGTGKAVQVGHVNKGNVHSDENPHAKKAADKYTFYAGIRGKSKYPPDRIAFAKFFAGAGFKGQDVGIHATRETDLRDGVFVEVGVGDAVKNSVTLFFEKHLNWTGIVMEGATPNLEKFNSSKRANSTVKIPKAACKNNGTAKMLGSGSTAGLEEFFPKDHETNNRKTWPAKWHKAYDVPCVALRDVLQTHKIKNVDLLSIDVEGAEAEVLKGLDFTSTNIRVIVLDLPVPKPANGVGNMEEEARTILGKQGFCLCSRIGPLEYWTSDPELRRQHCGWNSFRKQP